MSRLLQNVQQLQTQLSTVGDDQRRKAEESARQLQAELDALRARLAQEQETSRQTAQMRDIELQDTRGKIDKLVRLFTLTTLLSC